MAFRLEYEGETTAELTIEYSRSAGSCRVARRVCSSAPVPHLVLPAMARRGWKEHASLSERPSPVLGFAGFHPPPQRSSTSAVRGAHHATVQLPGRGTVHSWPA